MLTLLFLHQPTIVEYELVKSELLSSNARVIWPDASKIENDRLREPALF